MALPIDRDNSRIGPIDVIDRWILAPLQLDVSMPFDGITDLLLSEADPARQWFPRVQIDEDAVSLSLRRLVAKGLIACHDDSSPEAPEVALPFHVSEIRHLWYSLTLEGKEVFRHPVPWEFPIENWEFPKQESKLAEVVDSFRQNPEIWSYRVVRSGSAIVRGVRHWTSSLGFIRPVVGESLFVHILERVEPGGVDLLLGHFRPSVRGGDGFVDASLGTSEPSLTDLDDMILDVLSDDIENVDVILRILNHAETAYKRFHLNAQFAPEEVERGLVRLVEANLVVGYKAVATPYLGLEAVRPERDLDFEELWFGLTARVPAWAHERWPREETSDPPG